MLQALKWRAVGRDSASATWKAAGWAGGATAALGVAWLAVAPFLTTVVKGIVNGTVSAWNFSVGAYSDAFRDWDKAGEWMADAIGAMVISPVAFAILFVISVLLLLTTTAVAFFRIRSADYLWMLAVLIVSVVLTVVTGFGSVVSRISFPW